MFFKIIVRKINLKYKYKKKQKFFYKFVYTTHVFAAKQESKIFYLVTKYSKISGIIGYNKKYAWKETAQWL